MQRSWTAMVLTGIIALLAAVVITGPPSQTTDGIEIGAPRTTTTTTAAPTTTTSAPPSTTSEPEPAASTVPSSDPPATADPAMDDAASGGLAEAAPILGGADQPGGATADVAGEPVARDVLAIAVANATIAPGLAGRTADQLESLGYVDVGAIDTDVLRTTVLYHAPNHEAAARRLLADLGVDDVELQTLAAAPATTPPVDVVLLLVLAPDSI